MSNPLPLDHLGWGDSLLIAFAYAGMLIHWFSKRYSLIGRKYAHLFS